MPDNRYPFLDFPHYELVTGLNDIELYCACGHRKRLRRADFEALPGWSLHRIVKAAKCTACGKVGDIPQITVAPRHTGGFRERQS